jgi:hypothetical protein
VQLDIFKFENKLLQTRTQRVRDQTLQGWKQLLDTIDLSFVNEIIGKKGEEHSHIKNIYHAHGIKLDV